MGFTPSIPEGRQVVEAYGPGGFRIAGREHRGSVLVFPDRTLPWPVADPGRLSAESLGPAVEAAASLDLLILGCGDRFVRLPAALRAELRARGLVVEAMDTAAACRTYNVLLAEERRVAAALIAVS